MLAKRRLRASLGALPLFIKYDSHGEFVFDWGWADAYERSGRSYYPKLVAAIPFTPATGQRLLVRPGADTVAVADALIRGARTVAAELGASSLHVLFPTEPERRAARSRGVSEPQELPVPLAQRRLRGLRRVPRELQRRPSARRRSASAGESRRPEIVFEHLRGDEPTPADWNAIFEFYSRTFERRGREPYLNREFFAEIAATMPENLVIVLARHRGVPIAAAICFRSSTTLYGRYWGSLADFHSLHFETCYYQGIEYCIRERLQNVSSPARKASTRSAAASCRSATWSCHWLRDRDFHRAVGGLPARETRHVDAYMDELGEHVPYRDAAPTTRSSTPDALDRDDVLLWLSRNQRADRISAAERGPHRAERAARGRRRSRARATARRL